MIVHTINKIYIEYRTRNLTRSLLAHVRVLSDELGEPGKPQHEYEEQLLQCLLVCREILERSNDPKISALIHKVGYDVSHSYAAHCGVGAIHC